jgi:hypothetical protein
MGCADGKRLWDGLTAAEAFGRVMGPGVGTEQQRQPEPQHHWGHLGSAIGRRAALQQHELAALHAR